MFSATHVLFHVPTPFGWLPLEWYVHDSGPVTIIMIIFGLATSIVSLAMSGDKWWGGFGVFLTFNAFFLLMTAGGAGGCVRDGCELAQAMGVAYGWHLATLQIFVALFALTALGKFVDTFEPELKAVFGWFIDLSAERKGLLLMAPGGVILMVFVGGLGMAMHAGNGELLRTYFDTLAFSVLVWIAFALFVPGAWILIREEMRR